jgi:hypothetical protein
MGDDIAVEDHAGVKLGVTQCLLLCVDIDQRDERHSTDQVENQQSDIDDSREFPA